jgi:hypothetical protein
VGSTPTSGTTLSLDRAATRIQTLLTLLSERLTSVSRRDTLDPHIQDRVPWIERTTPHAESYRFVCFSRIERQQCSSTCDTSTLHRDASQQMKLLDQSADY